jgi:hypothetical protein
MESRNFHVAAVELPRDLRVTRPHPPMDNYGTFIRQGRVNRAGYIRSVLEAWHTWIWNWWPLPPARF